MLMPFYQKKPVTRADVLAACRMPAEFEEHARVERIEEEFTRGFDFLEKLPKTISIFGSTRTKETNPYYQQARSLAAKVVTELDYGIVTGGGPGIMEAANRGAHEAGGISAGLTIELPTQMKPNKYINRRCDFYYFFSRKVALMFAARMYVFFPGGYGTLDEFFELVTLVQTNKIQHVPIVCVGSRFWTPLSKWLNDYLLIQNEAINEEDLGLFTITDNEAMILEIAAYAEKRH